MKAKSKIPKGWRLVKTGEKIKSSDRYKWDEQPMSELKNKLFATPCADSIGKKFIHGEKNGWIGHFYRKVSK